MQGFYFTKSDPRLYCALTLLLIISGFKSAEAAFFSEPSCIKTGAQSLVDKIHEELVTVHAHLVDIKLNSPVSLLWFLDGPLNRPTASVDEDVAESDNESTTSETRSTGLLTERLDVPDDEDIDIKRRKEKALRDKHHVKVQTAAGSIYKSTGLIITIPFNTLGSIRFHPPVHESIQRASTICNVAAGFKMWALIGNISPDVDSVYRVQNRVDTINQIKLVNVDESFVKVRKLPSAKDGSQDISRNLSLVSVSSGTKVTDHAELAKLIRLHHPYASVRQVTLNDFNSDPWYRGSSLAVKAGTTDLFSNASRHAEYPYYPDRHVTIVGADITQMWGGFMEGAVQAGKQAAMKMREYFTPNPKEYNDNKTAPVEAWCVNPPHKDNKVPISISTILIDDEIPLSSVVTAPSTPSRSITSPTSRPSSRKGSPPSSPT